MTMILKLDIDLMRLSEGTRAKLLKVIHAVLAEQGPTPVPPDAPPPTCGPGEKCS